MRFWRYNQADYKVGDPLFTASMGYAHSVREYVVTRITKSGQVVAKLNDHEIRLTPSGNIAGKSRWSDYVISATQATEMTRRWERELAWRSIAELAKELASFAYRGHQDSAFIKYDELAQAIEARRAETGEDTGSVHESAIPGEDGDAPNA